MNRSLPIAIAALVVASGGLAHAHGGGKPTTPLHILLTDDDGFPASSSVPNTSAPGTAAVCEKLVAAGHRVTIVTPLRDQSGSSARVSAPSTGFGEFVVTQFTPPFSASNRFAPSDAPYVCDAPGLAGWALGDFNMLFAGPAPILVGVASPADSSYAGIKNILANDPPDLVVSGANNGQNVGRTVNHSGTVGAAITAAELGVPAIAISVELDAADLADRTPSETYPAMGDAGAFVVRLIAELQKTQRPNEPLVPAGIALNVNFPVVLDANGQYDPAAIGPAQITRVGTNESVVTTYPGDASSGKIGVNLSICGLAPCSPETVRDADTTALENGRISITPLDGDWTADEHVLGQLHGRLRKLIRP